MYIVHIFKKLFKGFQRKDLMIFLKLVVISKSYGKKVTCSFFSYLLKNLKLLNLEFLGQNCMAKTMDTG